MIALVILLSLFASTVEASTWYVRPATECTINGNGGAATCASAPGSAGAFSGAASINWTSVVPGDTLYICGIHQSSMQLGSTVAGTPTQPVTIDFACPGQPGKLRKQTPHDDALYEQNWIQETPYMWYFSTSAYINPPGRLWLNLVEQMPSETKIYLGSRVSPDGPMRGWWYDSANKRIYMYSRTNPALTAFEFRTLASTNNACDYSVICIRSTNKYIVFHNPVLEGGYIGSFYILGSSYIIIYGDSVNACKIGGLGARGMLVTDSAGNGTGTPANNIEVHHCTFDPYVPTTHDGYTYELNRVSGDAIAVLQGATDNYFHDLVIKNWQHASLNIVSNLGTSAILRNTFEYNTFLCEDHVEYCRAFALDGSASGKASQNIIRNNLISGMTVRSQLNGTQNIVQGNLFSRQRVGTIAIPGISQSLESQPYAGPSQYNTIKDNIFYGNPKSPCYSLRPGSTPILGNVISGNTFINCGGTDMVGAEYSVLYLPLTGAQTYTKNTFVVISGQKPIIYNSVQRSVAEFEQACSPDVCNGNTEIQYPYTFLDPTVPQGTQCGLGTWWEMGPGRYREFICFVK